MIAGSRFAAVLLACTLGSGTAFAAIPDAERQALLDLYASTNGDDWYFNDGWNGAAGTECSWAFVTCDAAGEHVTELQFSDLTLLSGNNLSGTLPASLNDLTALRVLVLAYNPATGPFPDISALTELDTLELGATHFSGPMPSLASFRHLRIFNAWRSGFSGPIPSLAGLTELAIFSADSCALTGEIPSLDGLTSLSYFSVTHNALSGPIRPLSNVPELSYFAVSDNRLTGPIPPIAGLRNLTTFDVSANLLSGEIPALTDLPGLHYVDVSSNELTGHVPSLAGAPSIIAFLADDNAFDGALPSLAGLDSLNTFTVRHNQLTGPLPSLEGLDNLVQLGVAFNRLSGALPAPPGPNLPDGGAALCPNQFAPTPSADWDAATGQTPWYTDCLQTTVELNQFGLTGTWYDPTMSGQGFLLDSMPDMDGAGGSVLFGGWFTYLGADPGPRPSDDPDDPANQRWYALQGTVPAGAQEAVLGVYQTEGGHFAAPPVVSADLIGYARIRFTDCETATFTSRFRASGGTGELQLKRLTGNTTCGQDGNNGADGGNSLLSGAWYDPTTSGQGMLVDLSATQHTLFAAWYTYARNDGDAPNQRWYTLQIGNVAPDATSISNVPIYLTTGGEFESTVPPLPPTTTVEVGRADVSFESCSAMTVGYVFSSGENEGLSGTLHFRRLDPVPPDCSF
jgi:hypothetical protein